MYMSSVTIYKNIISKLPLDMVKIIESYCDPETDYYRDKIIELSTKYDISMFGHNCDQLKKTGNIKYEILHNKSSILNIIDCMNQIPYVITPMKTVYNVGSYGGKHVIERYRDKVLKNGCYISNGEFMMAMLLCGYTMKTNYNHINTSFKASFIKEKVEKVKRRRRGW